MASRCLGYSLTQNSFILFIFFHLEHQSIGLPQLVLHQTMVSLSSINNQFNVSNCFLFLHRVLLQIAPTLPRVQPMVIAFTQGCSTTITLNPTEKYILCNSEAPHPQDSLQRMALITFISLISYSMLSDQVID